MMRRTAASSFVAGHTLFPGGRVEHADADPGWESEVVGFEAGRQGAPPGLPDGGLGHRVAAVRETLEEVGVPIGVDSPGLVGRRRAIDSGQVGFRQALAELGCRLDLSRVLPVGRWITPPGPVKRYDTYFFVADRAQEVSPVADGREAVEVEWVRPADALDRWSRGDLTMISPTIGMLQLLAEFATSGAVLAAAGRGSEPVQARILSDPPRGRGSSRVWWPGDPGYDAPGTEPTLGWVWIPRPDRTGLLP